jgi:hypothetical protein
MIYQGNLKGLFNTAFLTSCLLITAIFLISGCATPKPINTENPKDNIVIIGTGGTKGIYYPSGVAMCKIINKSNLSCGVESTSGAVSNLKGLALNKFDFVIARSEHLTANYKGIDKWEGKPNSDLRAVFNLYPDTVKLIVNVDAGIDSIDDLKGKRVNLRYSNRAVGQVAVYALASVGIDYKNELFNMNTAEFVKSFCDGEIDAFFYLSADPSGYVRDALSCKKKARIIPISMANGLIKKYPFFVKVKTQSNLYPNTKNRDDIETFGVWSTLVTSAKVPEDIVYTLTKEIFENLGGLKRVHPAYASVKKEDMLESFTVPIHPGALRYYKEVGLQMAQ